jgi:hypothetical protein
MWVSLNIGLTLGFVRPGVEPLHEVFMDPAARFVEILGLR